jgi:hypothetical protein
MTASAQHTHRGLDAVTHLLEHAPGTGGLALWMAHRDLDDDPDRGVALVQTDGRTLFYAPAFEDLPLPRQVGWVAHVMWPGARPCARCAAVWTTRCSTCAPMRW